MNMGINHNGNQSKRFPFFIIPFASGIFDNKTNDQLQSKQNADKQVASKVGPTISVGDVAL